MSRSDAAAILRRLHDELSVAGTAKVWEPSENSDASLLVRSDSFAFLLAVIADYHIPAERAWSFPYELSRVLGHLEPQRLARTTPEALEAAIRLTPKKHRYPATIARWYIAASKRVTDRYSGNAANIWKGRTVHDASLHLDAFLGIGQKKASMAVNILCRDLGWLSPSEPELRFVDVSFDVHVRRVFGRAGFVQDDTLESVLAAARTFSPDYPGKLDLGAWHVGRTWCHLTRPLCNQCALGTACARVGVQGQ